MNLQLVIALFAKRRKMDIEPKLTIVNVEVGGIVQQR